MARQSYHCAIRDDRCPPVPSHYVVQACNLAHDKITRSARSFYPISSSTASMTAIPPEKTVRSLLSAINPALKVQAVEAVPPARLQRLYKVKVSEGPSLLLALPPPSAMRLLRFEQSSIGSEAALLTWLSGLSKEMKKSYVGADEGLHNDPFEFTEARKTGTSRRPPKILFEYLPVLLEHGSMNGNSYNLSRPPRGVAVSTLSPPLTLRERKAIDFHIGQLLRCISMQTSPNGKFGLVTDVLGVPRPAAQLRRLEGGLHYKKGASSWSAAFKTLLESVLRDAEDLAIVISYGTIRRHSVRFEHLLDGVTEPRLVAIDVGEDLNTLVLRASKVSNIVDEVVNTDGKTNGKVSQSIRKSPDAGSGGDTDSSEDDSEGDSDDDSDNGVGAFEPKTNIQAREQIQVTGLRQWSNCIFGDPLIASVFSKHPSPEFRQGFGNSISIKDSKTTSSSIIEDEPNARVRILLYECYHAVAAVVREFYRPHRDGKERELVARKRLNDVLARLDELDDAGVPRRRRPSGEMSPAKRPKTDDSDESEESEESDQGE